MTSSARICRTSPELARVNTPEGAGIAVLMFCATENASLTCLAGYQLHPAETLLRVDLDDQAVEDSLGVFAARIGDPDALEALHPLGLVDVTVQAEHRPVLHDGIPRPGAAAGHHLRAPGGHAPTQFVVQPWRQVQAGAQRRDVQAENGLVHVLDPRGGLVDSRRRLFFRDVTPAP